ncbi:MAG: hypothetical protein IPN91_03525 [Holophagaceae bacterium]|uniref:Uncharacterized protein n=1 Tax=Candidatus Geothrix odensensis TaxID=2954440 RepID=A0A936K619_9BACT|nr:hypothetical protein [Candidatus Geothrix odensensis]
MRVKDIFTPGSYPEHTFINEHIIDKQRHFLDALEMGSGVISISGPSKSGKTVFVENLVGKEHLVHVTGAGVDIPEKLWERVFDKVGTRIRTSRSATKANESELGGKVGVKPEYLSKEQLKLLVDLLTKQNPRVLPNILQTT